MLIGHSLHHMRPTAVDSSLPTSATSQTISNTKSRLDPHRVRELTFIGVGSSVAYLLNELNGRFADSGVTTPFLGKVSIVGKDDSWAENVRGRGYINHQTEIISQWDQQVPNYDPNYAARAEFSASNRRQLTRTVELGAEHLKAQVTGISRLDDGCFRINLDNGQILQSRQIVLGTGAGPHTSIWNSVTSHTQAEKRLDNIKLHEQKALRGKVLDLDEFMRASDASPQTFAGKTVVIHGPNAGIDAAERAGELGANAVWFTRSTNPVLLDGNQLKFAPELAKSAIHKVDKLDIRPTKLENGFALRLHYSSLGQDSREPKKVLDADYYVYAMGQDIHKPGSAAAILGSLLDHLEPIYDYDQAYSDQPFKTVIGLQSRGSNSDNGLIIVGAAVAQLATNVQHSYKDHALDRILEEMTRLPEKQTEKLSQMLLEGAPSVQIQTYLKTWQLDSGQPPDKQVLQNQVENYLAARDYFQRQTNEQKGNLDGVAAEVKNQTLTEVASVIVSPQLGTIKASAAALSGLMPAYVANGENNFTTDNRTMLRAGIAARYPNIGNAEASAFIDEVVTLRHLNSQRFIEKVAGEMMDKGAQPLVSLRPPVLGVPASVRTAYEAYLHALNSGAHDGTPLSQRWLPKK
ncbi:type III secretion system effector HopAD1 [Pseudomonas syringae group genomosp. 3]|uniref:type III secretion system effector HopAD1 n=1 Tax=Pseudomonas syringae group genomosp. 3 TaxID=251701 RepID=UPI0006E5F033|nr:type III secretion system effector HopAD1 [Pseudomonas syringae group genomosp. 3]KPW48604.1 Effector protein hopAD1 [Pseudomonas syringae pv. berberidis]RMP69420.1 Effector protein hopAD1 [Pseudomonas syringae pv. berberidis]RMQ42164.1 Effector protein hopAD1 [Pseudomonas syringae pv. berberidis]